MNHETLEYDLYLDESGDFMEVLRVEKERQRSATRRLGAPSQLVGMLVPRVDIVEQEAKAITDAVKNKTRLPPTEPIHAISILKKHSRYQYQKTVQGVIRAVECHTAWQAVRLVNRERVSYYDGATNYINLVAELTLRVFMQKSREQPGTKIGIRIIINPRLVRKDSVLHVIPANEYVKKVEEYLGFITVRYGLANEQRKWRLDGVLPKEYRQSASLQICDVLTSASYDNFAHVKGNRHLTGALKRLFGDYDFTLTTEQPFGSGSVGARPEQIISKQPVKAFISYKWEDDIHNSWVMKLAADLRARGIDALLDQWEVRLGDSFSDYMTTRIHEADVVLFVITTSSVSAVEAPTRKGGALKFEMQMAQSRMVAGDDMRLIGIYREGSRTPAYLRDHRYADFRDDTKYDESLEKLVDDLMMKDNRPVLQTKR